MAEVNDFLQNINNMNNIVDDISAFPLDVNYNFFNEEAANNLLQDNISTVNVEPTVNKKKSSSEVKKFGEYIKKTFKFPQKSCTLLAKYFVSNGEDKYYAKMTNEERIMMSTVKSVMDKANTAEESSLREIEEQKNDKDLTSVLLQEMEVESDDEEEKYSATVKQPTESVVKQKTVIYDDKINPLYHYFYNEFSNMKIKNVIIDLLANSTELLAPKWKNFLYGNEVLKKINFFIKNATGEAVSVENNENEDGDVTVFEFMSGDFLLDKHSTLKNLLNQKFTPTQEISDLLVYSSSLAKITKSRPFHNKNAILETEPFTFTIEELLNGQISVAALVGLLLYPKNEEAEEKMNILEGVDFINKFPNFIRLFIENKNLKVFRGIVKNYSSEIRPTIAEIEKINQFLFMGTANDIAMINLIDWHHIPKSWIFNYNCEKIFNVCANKNGENFALSFLQKKLINLSYFTQNEKYFKILPILNVSKLSLYLHLVLGNYTLIIPHSSLYKEVLNNIYTVKTIKCFVDTNEIHINLFHEHQYLGTLLNNGTFVNNFINYTIPSKKQQQCVYLDQNNGISLLTEIKSKKRKGDGTGGIVKRKKNVNNIDDANVIEKLGYMYTENEDSMPSGDMEFSIKGESL